MRSTLLQTLRNARESQSLSRDEVTASLALKVDRLAQLERGPADLVERLFRHYGLELTFEVRPLRKGRKAS